MIKQCSLCRAMKTLNSFYKNKSTKDGYAYYCKECHNESIRLSNIGNPNLKAIHAAALEKYSQGKGKRFSQAPLTSYYGMRMRCLNPNHPAYKNYGGRGIKCEWKDGRAFLKDMESSYKPGLTIDRIDNNGNYSKENCRWVNMKTQNNNRRDNLLITWNNITKTLHQWADTLGIKYPTLYKRVAIEHWSLDRAFTYKIKYLEGKR